MSHRIHLRGFWVSTALDGGRVRHARKFGRPRTLGPGETLWVVADGLPPSAVVFVNGVPIDGPLPPDLPPRNELAIETDGPLGDVALEVRVGSPNPVG